MGIFKRKGIDNKVLRATKFWKDFAMLIDTDEKTLQQLVEYTYLAVADARIEEANNSFEKLRVSVKQEAMIILETRISQLESYKKLYEEKNKK
jgi:hypothetical protein